MSLEKLREELKNSVDEKINNAINEAELNKINTDSVRKKLLAAVEDKKTNRSEVARVTGLGYITIINVLNEGYEFEVKASTLQKIEDYLNAL